MIEFYNADAETVGLANRIYKETLKHFGQEDIFEIEAEIISAEEMRALNAETRNVDSVTDVLSYPSLEIKSLPVAVSDFPYDVDPDSGKLILGELAMCMEKIEAQAEEFGHTKTREAGYLFLHGLLHLLGFDHIEEADKAVMRSHEEAILNGLNILR